MKYIYSFLILTFYFFSSFTIAQTPIPVSDVLCISENDSIDITLNDTFPSGQIILLDQTMCFQLNGYFLSFDSSNPDCPCDSDYQLQYFYESNSNQLADIRITIKCDVEKPECFLTDLSDFDPISNPGAGDCLYACEYETSTYFVPHVIGNTYAWVISGAASYSTNVNQNEVYITWGTAGAGNINLTVTNGGNSENYNFCVDVLEGPTAIIDALTDCVCLGGSMTFLNNSTGAGNYLWDFGDGSTSTLPEPTHTFLTPGTYTVTLYAYRNNLDGHGNPLCCCTDSTSIEIMVDDLEGPPIYWISTLCLEDKSYYWTDAADCSTYEWTVQDANGDPVAFTGNGTDSICVTWGDGPYGSISLEVSGCSTTYCEKPSTVVVPIISSVSVVIGDDEVCANSTTTYSVPKWPSVTYDWTVTGGTILSDSTSHVITVLWSAGPTGTIHVDYESEFLSGLPGHDINDCGGTGDLIVDIRPKFLVSGPMPAIACINDVSNFSATTFPSSSYSWSITPYAPFTGDGTAIISVDWSTGPGTYTIQCVTNAPNDYCNDTVRLTMLIIDLPAPDSIVGPIRICPNESNTYLGYTATPNTTLEWMIEGGSPSTFSGSPITITWNAVGPYSISLAQQQVDAPECLSDTIKMNVTPKLINEPLYFPSLNACINEVVNYSAGPAQEEEAILEWKISPVTAGSVVDGQGTLNPTIQWNNDAVTAYLSFCVTLCDVTKTITDTIQLKSPTTPTITQIGDLCPGVSALLDASSGFATYSWSGPVVSTSEDISITEGGTYILTTTDGDGCEATTTIDVVELPAPDAIISSPDDDLLCLPAIGKSVTLHALTNPDYELTWLCNGDTVLGPGTGAIYTHNGTNVVNTFAYCVYVRNTVTGCISKSSIFTVTQDTCSSGGGGDPCIPENYSLNVVASTDATFCNQATFTTSASPNVIITGWDFDDPNGNANDGSLTIAQHTYNKASYYTVRVWAQVPEVNSSDYCTVMTEVSVCIPLAANFTYTDSCDQVCFENLSTYLPGHGGLTYEWAFDDGFISLSEHPCHTYLAPGTYDVTLTVTNLNGCQASHIETLTVASFGSLSMNILPPSACVGDPIDFSGFGPGIVNWLWDFDDGATNGNQSTSHAYLAPGVYDVSLTVVNLDGCDTTISSDVTIYPLPSSDTISYDSTLVICEGDQVMLYAPSGPYSYEWNTGAVTSYLLVGSAGDYSVIYTDANGCENETPPVTVVLIPKPIIEISGPSYICDEGCITLQATTGAGYTYQWLDAFGNAIGGAVTSTYDVCDDISLPASFYVEVTDANGCSVQAGPHTVDLAVSPSFSITVVGDECEGSPNILSAPILPNVRYQWSTGDSGLSITAFAAGTYTVIGTDTTTNCSHSATTVIHPLPDLCIVPTGCYEVCDPDTICGPDELAFYQWNKDGIPISGETNQCLIVTESGSYSLTGTNEFGCTLTSDTLILNVIECVDCSMQDVTSKVQAGLCCYSVSYTNSVNSLYTLLMHTSDATIDPDLGTIDPALDVVSIGSNYIEFGNSTVGDPLPTGNLFDFIEFCLTDVTSNPQIVIFDWYNELSEVVCSDTLVFDCPIDSDCIYVAEDTIYCVGEDVFYSVTICNSTSNTFDFNYIVLNPVSPFGIVVSPSFLDLTGSPITPGTCQTHVFALSGPDIANMDFCFDLVGHSEEPTTQPEALCCSLDTLHCIQIPGCTPCDMVYVEDVIPTEDSCCYDIVLHNDYAPDVIDGVVICALSPAAGLTIDLPSGRLWKLSELTESVIALKYNATVPFLPLGSIELPTICVDASSTPYQEIEIKWMHGDDVVCRDTIELYCAPECGYPVNDTVLCDGDQWYLETSITNTSDVTMNEAYISFNDPLLSGYNQTIALGSLAPGATFGPIFLLIGPPATANQTICITVTMHELDHGQQHINCCNFAYCFILPDCMQSEGCLCDEQFELEVEQGFSCVIGAGFSGTFAPLGALTACDQVRWHWDDGSPDDFTTGIGSINHTFPSPGEYEVCIVVTRLDVNGKKCKEKFCKEVDVKQMTQPLVFPNPAKDELYITWPENYNRQVNLKVFTLNQDEVIRASFVVEEGNHTSSINVALLPPGVYVLVVETEESHYVERLIVF